MITKREFRGSQLLARYQFTRSDTHFSLTDQYLNRNLGLSILVSGRGDFVQLIRIMSQGSSLSLPTTTTDVIRLQSMILCEFVYGIDSWFDERLLNEFTQGVYKILETAKLDSSLSFHVANVEMQVLTRDGEVAGIQARTVKNRDGSEPYPLA